MKIPVIENIHQKILEAVSQEGALDMDTYHSCETTHCRAGWAIHLAGAEGYALENKTSPLFAGLQIFKASSKIPVAPTRFFESNEVAIADMQRCADLEKKANAALRE
jgi:hypothetical protein